MIRKRPDPWVRVRKVHTAACIHDLVHEDRGKGKEDRQTAFLLGVTRIEQVHNHLAVHIHIEQRELGRFSLVYNQFRVTTRGGVNVVGCGEGGEKGKRERERGRIVRIHGVYSRLQECTSVLRGWNILCALYIAGTMPSVRYNARIYEIQSARPMPWYIQYHRDIVYC